MVRDGCLAKMGVKLTSGGKKGRWVRRNLSESVVVSALLDRKSVV